MGCETNGYVGFGLYALVSYIQKPLSSFLDDLRLELAACQPHAHVTILPPRSINATEDQAKAELQQLTAKFHAFEVKLGKVELFERTNVIYIEIVGGASELRQMHRMLNTGAMEQKEPFDFHPHITLAQSIPLEKVQDTLIRARELWSAWLGSRSFTVAELSFVQNQERAGWVDLLNLPLAHEPAKVMG
jgi:2'-5' RNA ligase